MAYIGNGSDTITRQEYTFTATEGQTTFIADYTVGYVDVFWNGFKIDSSEYVANNGTTIIVKTALKAGDKFSVIAYNAFNIADTYSKREAETYVANYVDSVALGVGQTWQDVTASRVLGTTYTNSTGKPISLNIWCVGTAISYNITININGVATYFNQDYANAAGYTIGASTIIPNGATYNVVTANATLTKWFELR